MPKRTGETATVRPIAVGDRDVLRGGLVIECVEVYMDGGKQTGRWVEIGYVERTALVDVAPRRVVLSRKRGWKLPEGAVSCARPHRYGNPFIVATPTNGGNITRADAVRLFREALLDGRLQFSVDEVRRELRGRDLACWCPLDAECHVDVLLEIANGADA